MGWTVYIEAAGPTPDLDELNELAEQVTEKLDERSEGLYFEPEGESISAFCKIQGSSTPDADFAILIEAAKALKKAFPTLTWTFSDDYNITEPVDPDLLDWG